MIRACPPRAVPSGIAIVLTAVIAAMLGGGVLGQPQGNSGSPNTYRFTFPEAQHHWMQVEATFDALASGPLELRMSRSSPGRYSLHDFAKNVYDVEAFGPGGGALRLTRPDPYGWTLSDHGSRVSVRYKVFGDRVDGTYLAVDLTHAHINMPAAILWARGREDLPSTLTFEPPAGTRWEAATQLQPGAATFEFTAPNLQYLMDSPVEIGPVAIRQFEVGGRRFRFSAHHTGSDAELDAFVRDVEKIVREEGSIFGEYPDYEPGTYTFLADYLPYANGDGMEHRNSTVMTSSASIASNRASLLDTVAHEFFHNWNVERIRPKSLEPFDFERANMSGELWLAEGFTQYYGPLTLSRTGLQDLSSTAATFNGLIESVTLNPGRDFRSPEEMSRMAPFTDGGRTVDRTNWPDTFISYYPYGGAIALALDLSLRERSGDRVTLDDFMRAMWRAYGKPGGSRPGYVDHPYTLADAEQQLAVVSGDGSFAREFFAKYVHGRDLPDYTSLLEPAGLALRKQAPGRPWWGDVRLEPGRGLRVASAPLANTPAYKAGLDVGDELFEMDGDRVSSADEAQAIVARHKPGEVMTVMYSDRTGQKKTARITLVEDPRVELVPLEATGGTLTDAQRAFRQSWLGR